MATARVSRRLVVTDWSESVSVRVSRSRRAPPNRLLQVPNLRPLTVAVLAERVASLSGAAWFCALTFEVTPHDVTPVLLPLNYVEAPD